MTEPIFRSDMGVELIRSTGDDTAVAEAAWISNYGGDVPADRARRVPALINFLMRDRHGTPFEHNSMTFLISAPLFVFYEFHRHRVGWSYNEESARYRELEPVFYVPPPGRPMVQVGSPGKYSFVEGSELHHSVAEMEHHAAAASAWESYQHQLQIGVAREVARNVLPVSVFKSMYATCNLRSLFAFLSLRRTHPLSSVPTFPLREIEEVATKMEELARPLFPECFGSFDRNGRVAP